MNSSVGTAPHESKHLCFAYEVEVSADSVFECGRGNCKLKGLGLVLTVFEHTVDEASGEGIPAAHAVYDGINLVAL